MIYGYIYKIPFPNGKHYIGISKDLIARKRAHYYACKNELKQLPLYNALRKYNMQETFELIEVDTANTEEELKQKEIMYIVEFNSYINNNGYNATFGGDGTLGRKASQEEKDAIGARMKKIWQDKPEIFAKTEETKQKLSASGLAYYSNNSEARKRQSLYMKNNPLPHAFKKGEDNISRESRMKALDTLGKNKEFVVYKDDEYIGKWKYQCDAKNYLKVEYNITGDIAIHKVLNGTRKSSQGFTFEYVI
jgi:predicted GIY-YIG superfamily endonuclease